MSRRKFRKKRSHGIRYSILIVVIIFVAAYVSIILTRPLKPIYAVTLPNPVTTSGTLNVAWPSAGESSIGVLGDGSLVSNGVQTPTPTASIAKVVTALAVLKKYPLSLGQQGPALTLTQADVNDYNAYVAEDGSVVKVAAGEQINEYQALQAMLLPSGDNMADTLAIWAYGSLANYVIKANSLVKSLGMNSTTIADASGFSPSTVSTSEDLVKLGEAALYSPVLAQIVDQKSANLPVAGVVTNVDWFVGQNDLVGIKTGNTDQAGGCFLSAATYDLGGGNSITVIGAVMKSTTLQVALNQTIPMLQSVKNSLQLKILSANTIISTYKEPWGGSVIGVTKTAVALPYLPGLPISYTNKSNSLTPPAASSTNTGKVLFGVGNVKNSTDTMTIDKTTEPSNIWKLTHPGYFL